jgi:hypothetical protein
MDLDHQLACHENAPAGARGADTVREPKPSYADERYRGAAPSAADPNRSSDGYIIAETQSFGSNS